jgi:hypothetical protein
VCGGAALFGLDADRESEECVRLLLLLLCLLLRLLLLPPPQQLLPLPRLLLLPLLLPLALCRGSASCFCIHCC